MFINDIARDLDTSVVHIIYADDLQICVRFPFEKLQSHVALMSSSGDLVLQWAERHQLLLNMSKSKAIVITSYY